MISFEHLKPASLLPSDWLLLGNALGRDYSGFTVHDLAGELDRFESQLWLLRGPELRLLLVTEFVALPAGKELHLRLVAGKGWFKHFGPVYDVLENLAKTFDCRFISGKLRGRHAETWYKRFGGQPQGVVVMKDLWNVKQTEDNSDEFRSELRPAGNRECLGTRH